MKILIATGLYPPDIGGPATYTKMLEQHIGVHGMQLVVVPFGLVRRYPRIVRHFVYLWKVVWAGRGADCYYALDPVSVGLPVYIAHLLTRKPYLVRIAGDYAWEQGQQRFGLTETLDDFLKRKSVPFPVQLLQRVQTWVAQHTRGIVVPSNYMKGVVACWGIKPERITRIYSALHPLPISSSRDGIRKQLGYSGTVITTAGRLVPWKGMRTLIGILPELRKLLGNVTLVIIGDGPLEAELKAYSESLGVSGSVQFPGRLPKDALATAVGGSDLFVLNTSYEGMSHQLLEVMNLGVPIVATDVGGNPELIEDGVTGFLVPYDDRQKLIEAITTLMTNETVRTAIAAHAQKRTEAFREEVVVAALAQFLKETL